MKNYSLGLQEGDASIHFFAENGFVEDSSNIEILDKRVLTYRMLLAGRINLIAAQDITVQY